jgi:MFS family permease
VFLIAANIVEGLVAGLLAFLVATGRPSAPLVTGVVFVGGCFTALRLPFHQAMTPDLVPREDLLAAAALSSAQYNLGRVLGPTIAGGTIALWGIEWVFMINALSFLAVVGALVLVRLPRHVTPPKTDGVWARIRDGARIARAEPGCRAAISLMALAAFFAAPFIALIPARAFDLTNGGGQDAVARVSSYLTTAQGIGAVIGAVVVAEVAARIGRQRVIIGNLTLTCVAVVFYAHAPSVVTATVAIALLGSIYIGILSGLSSTIQMRAPAEYRGRVLSLHLVALGAVYPLGGVVQGYLADRIGLASTTTIAALIMLTVLVFMIVRRPAVFSALRDPDLEGVDDFDEVLPAGAQDDPVVAAASIAALV